MQLLRFSRYPSPGISLGQPTQPDHLCHLDSSHCSTSQKTTILSIVNYKKIRVPESASELYWPSDHRLSAKLVPIFLDRGCHVVSVTNPYRRILGFLDRSRYFFFQIAPQLYSRGWVDPVPDPLLLRKSGSDGNRTWDLWICSQELWPLDHRGGLLSST
jgi:hypothetical protein